MIVTKGNELKKYITGKTAVALGSFDAIHKGHLEIINSAVRYAKENNLSAVVQIFTVPVGAEKACINSFEKRVSILESLGVDAVVAEDFDDNFKNTSYDEFVKEYLFNKYNASAVFAGDNYRFGQGAKGDKNSLTELCEELGIKVNIIKCLEDNGVISSTRIRQCILSGRVDEAKELMSRPYSVSGTVVHGREVGRTIDFPTANINLPKGMLVPADGVYRTRVRAGENEFSGITNVGAKPTVNVDARNIETHIIGMDDDLYGREIEIFFEEKIRDIKKFDSIDELKKQLEEDIKSIK